ncbi:CPBP family intramembrane glutamic endopeptidase [Natrialba sp. PRR66]|uniref:CPBP family intramembrane glutamic endopeptidase n=1 Tax=Natrialba sp. PRR66 TaxID=3098146 RepID=UPI002B1D9125|nr:CPBP family intramembrane glutamic endopeptidase [Natrialba sp. PRR66]
MSTVSPFWIILLLATPLLSLAYMMTIYVVVHRWLPVNFHLYAHWFNSGFVVVVGSAVVFTSLTKIPLTAQWIYLATIPLGVGLYVFDSYIKVHIAEKPLRNGTESVVTMLPVLFVPIFEEIIFRGGYVFLEHFFGTGVFVVVSAFSFGIHHIGYGKIEVLFKFENGLVYGSLFVVTGSLLPPLLAHCGYNLAAVLVHADTSWLTRVSLQVRS